MYLTPVLQAIEQKNDRVFIEGLKEGAQDLLISHLRLQLSQNILIIVPTQREVEQTVSNLCFFAPTYKIYPYPTREILPYEELSPDPEIISQRICCLQGLLYEKNLIIVACVRAIMDKLIPRSILGQCTGYYGISESIDREELISDLLTWGYERCDLVYEKGQFSVRGAIIDLFLPDSECGCRLEFFGDEITSIREFDPSSQRSLKEKKEVVILPVRECILNKERKEHLIKNLRENFGSSLPHKRPCADLIRKIEESTYFPGMEFYLPYIYPLMESLWDYLSRDDLIILKEEDRLGEIAELYEQEINDRFHKMAQQNIPYPKPEENFYTAGQIKPLLKKNRQIIFTPLLENKQERSDQKIFTYHQYATKDLLSKEKIISHKNKFLANLAQKLKGWQRDKYRLILVCLNESQAERLRQILDEFEIGATILPVFPLSAIEAPPENPVPIEICLGDVSSGFCIDFMRLVILPEGEIFGQKHRVPTIKFRRSSKHLLSDFNELKINDYVVHVDHGIGQYRGLTRIKVGDVNGDFLILEYKGGDKLYVPSANLELIEKYTGSSGAVISVDKLGGTTWARTKAKVKKAIEDIAQDLLELYAKREMAEGIKFPPDDTWQGEFEASFEYEETPDQVRTIHEVKKDMESRRPMDRLICGDVGYGKTEIAMRATFKSVMAHYQVAIIAPTTILVQQHFENFMGRFSPYPVQIEMLSRFVAPKEQKRVINDLKTGTVDIVIGTHKLLQKNIGFKNLGLLIIDEEHRFGVKHKERLKQLRYQVDVMTLSATPIPRTLYMSTVGARDMSLIETPPRDRLPISTYIVRFDTEIIIQGCQRELDRGGQIFFVHNRVESIYTIAEFLRRLIPQARIGIGHGQMSVKELEKIMFDFTHQKYDILVCTSIIESGLDIPTVNTIFINRADCFGLAQLYQLRGRIGRGSHRAYAYLLVPSKGSLTDEAKKRLAAMEELSELGSGFRLAARDLEIRGAGNLLGKKQHGHINAIGFDLYCDLINEVMAQLKGEPAPEISKIEINLNFESFLPADYINNINQRLSLYKRISMIDDITFLQDIDYELRDVYGPLPEPAQTLLRVIKIKIMARHLGIIKLERQGKIIQFTFSGNDATHWTRASELAAQYKECLLLHPPNILYLILQEKYEKIDVFKRITWLFDEFKIPI
ncbi:MAG: transcription-repair coupling factor [bacterium]